MSSNSLSIIVKLSNYAKKLGIKYHTAYGHFKKGLIEGAYQLKTGTIIVPDQDEKKNHQPEFGVIIYARVSTAGQLPNLNSQAERLKMYSIARGYKIKSVVKEVGSGINDRRKKLTMILQDGKYDKIIIEHKDRLTRFGFNWFQLFTNNRIEVVNESESEMSDITADIVAIMHSFSSKLYGLRRRSRKVIELIEGKE